MCTMVLWLQVAENYLSLRMLRTVLDQLLGSGFQVSFASRATAAHTTSCGRYGHMSHIAPVAVSMSQAAWGVRVPMRVHVFLDLTCVGIRQGIV